jgi:hypothetical protein
VLIRKETLWKNNLKFVKDVPMIYVNFMITVNKDCEKKNRRHYYCTTPHTTISFQQKCQKRLPLYEISPLQNNNTKKYQQTSLQNIYIYIYIFT